MSSDVKAFICQVHRNTDSDHTNKNALPNKNASFSDPVNESSSDAESFNEDEMYGSDHVVEFVCESSDDGKEEESSHSSENEAVSLRACPIMSTQLTAE
jgi:hypothetical protein